MTTTLEPRQLPGRVVRTPAGKFSFRIDLRAAIVCTILVIASLAVAVVSIGTGDFPIPIPDVIRTLVGRERAPPSSSSSR